jgi:hypothetical protein
MRVIAFLFLMLWVGVVIAKDKNEILEFALGLEWKPAYSSDRSRFMIMEFVREGDDINNWKELVTYQNFGRNGKESPEETLNKLKATREKNCPGVTEWNVIDKNESRVLYEWHAKPCLSWPEQSELATIIVGRHNVFLLHYAAKVHELAPDTRAQWIKRFSAAAISSSQK